MIFCGNCGSIKIRYQLLVIQQPVSVSSSFFHGDAPRRNVITPCPIFQLVAAKQDGSVAECPSQLGDVSRLLAHAIIFSPNGDDASFIGSDPRDKSFQPCEDDDQDSYGPLHSRNLEGTIVSVCYSLRDLNESLKAYFVFQDLSVNLVGKYRLKICVSRMSGYIHYK